MHSTEAIAEALSTLIAQMVTKPDAVAVSCVPDTTRGGGWLECPAFSVPVRNDKTGIERSLRWHEARSIRQSKL